MAYTQADIDLAKVKMENANSALSSAYSSMTSWCNLVTGRTYTEGTNKTTCSHKVAVICGETIDAICCRSLAYSDDTCESDKNKYNTSVLNYDKKTDEYENAKDYYEEVSGDKVQGDVDLGVAKIEEEAKAIRTRYYVFGGIVIILLVAGIFIYMKLRK